MSGDWIKMRIDLPDDPAVIGIAAGLGISEDEVVGKLHRLWGWADRQSTSGRARNITPAWIDRHLGCPGFAASAERQGWLMFDADGVVIPNFERHNGKSAKARAEATDRKRASRLAGQASADVADVSHDSRDRNETREEKRREEKKERESSAAPPPPPPGETTKAEAKQSQAKSFTFDTWVARAAEAGVKPIPDDHCSRAYAETIGIPPPYLRLHWLCFRRRFSGTSKKYTDWGRVFLNSLHDHWFGLWYVADDGSYQLTTKGKQAEIEFREGQS